MGRRDPRVGAYIEKSANFARPILKHIRAVVHETCPEAEETMKWSMPHFDYAGSMMLGMASFKEHCALGFWKGELILGKDGVSTEAMGQFGCIRSVSDLPPKRVLAGYIRQAMKLNDQGVTRPRAKKTASGRKEIAVPTDLAAALKNDRRARETFDAFSPSHRREYIEWITEARRPETRRRRVDTTIEWLSEGKQRNWKYQRS